MAFVFDPVGNLQRANIGNDLRYGFAGYMRLGRHIAKSPMMLWRTDRDRTVEGVVGVVPGIVDIVDKRWSLVGPQPRRAMASGAILREGSFTFDHYSR